MGLESLGIVSMKDESILREMFGLSSGIKKMGTNKLVTVKSNMATALQKIDMIQFLERYKWSNLPKGITQDLIERILYFRGRGVLFKKYDEFFFLPFGLEGEIDTYGRYKGVKPLAFNGTAQIGGEFLPGMTLNVMRDKDEEGLDPETYGIILYDTSIMLSQYNLPPFYQQMFIISEQADVLVLIKKNLINSTVLYTIVAQNDNQKTMIEQDLMNWADENLLKYITVISSTQQVGELKGSAKLETQSLFEAWTSYDNLRKTMIGLKNNGLFQKTSHSLEMEVSNQEEQTDAVFTNGLRMRKDFCEMAKILFDIDIKVEANISEQDVSDSKLGDNTDPSLDDREDHKGDE